MTAYDQAKLRLIAQYAAELQESRQRQHVYGGPDGELLKEIEERARVLLERER